MLAGDVIWDPLTGEKALLIESASESGGARIVAEFAVEEGGFVPGGEHVHDHLDEHFDVLQGQITYLLDGQEKTVGGASRSQSRAAAGIAGGTPARARSVSTQGSSRAPLGGSDRSDLGPLCRRPHRRRRARKAGPAPRCAACDPLPQRSPLPATPQLVQRILLPPLGAVARTRGLEKTIERYLDIDTHPSGQRGLGRLPEQVMARA
jgi:hypothetical protein